MSGIVFNQTMSGPRQTPHLDLRTGIDFNLTIPTILLSIYCALLLITKYSAKSRKSVPQVYKWQSYIPGLDRILLLLQMKNDGCHAFDNWTAGFGKIFRVNSFLTKAYVTADADIIQKVVGSSDYSYVNKPKFYKVVLRCVQINSGLFILRGSEWAIRRRLLNRSFTNKSLQTYLSTINKFSRKMVTELPNDLHSFPDDDDGSSMNFYGTKEISDAQNLLTMRIALNILMGADLYTDEEIRKFTDDFRRAKDLAVFRLFHPWCVSDLIFRLYPEGREFFVISNYNLDMIRKRIKIYKTDLENLKGDEKLSVVNKSDQDPDIGLKPHRFILEEMICSGFTDDEILDEVFTFLIAGHETTVTTTNSFMLMMALNPDSQAKCHEEIDELFAEKATLTNDGTYSDLTMNDVCNLKYTERCLQETLRLVPTIPLFNRGIEKSLELGDDLEIEGGSDLMVNIWSLHRDPKHFPDPLKFDPDRFLPENVKARHKFAYLAFSSGIRNCIGWKLAMIEIKVAMAWLLKHFEIRTKEPLRFEEMKFLYELTTIPETEIDFVLKRRTQTSGEA